MVTIASLIKKYPQKTGKFVFLSRFCQNVSFSTCDFNIFHLLWSKWSGFKFKFFQLFKDFYINTRPACSILGKKCISILGFGNKPSCACSIWLRSHFKALVAQQPPCACSIFQCSHPKAQLDATGMPKAALIYCPINKQTKYIFTTKVDHIVHPVLQFSDTAQRNGYLIGKYVI